MSVVVKLKYDGSKFGTVLAGRSPHLPSSLAKLQCIYPSTLCKHHPRPTSIENRDGWQPYRRSFSIARAIYGPA